jgi:hypothetical protein
MTQLHLKRKATGAGIMGNKVLVAAISVALTALLAVPTTFMLALADTQTPATAAATEEAPTLVVSDVQADTQGTDTQDIDTQVATTQTSVEAEEAADETAASQDASDTATTETTSVRIVLAEGTLAEGQKAICADLERKTDGGWEKTGDMSLAESRELEVTNLEPGTYRVTLDDLAETRELSHDMTITSGKAKVAFASAYGTYLDVSTDDSLITVALAAPEPDEVAEARDENTEEAANAPNAPVATDTATATETTIANPVPDTVDPADELTWVSADTAEIVAPDAVGIDAQGKARAEADLAALGATSITEVLMAGASQRTSATSALASAGDPPASFSGNCYIAWFSTVGSYTSFGLTDFSDVPSGFSVSDAHCISPGLPEGTGWSSYTATLSSVDEAAGKAYYSLFVAAPYAGAQNVGATLVLDWEFSVSVNVQKVSADPTLTEGNACYSFAGAHFILYKNWSWNQADWPIDELYLLTADATGATNTITGLDPGWYYIRETDAPTGYALNTNTYPIHIESGNTATVTIPDEPKNDPASMWVVKVDSETTLNMPQGSASLAGAEFTIDWYGGWFGYDGDGADAYADVKSQSDWGAGTYGVEHRTWVVATDKDGFAQINDAYKVGGDDFFHAASGKTILPAGTLVIKETKAPEGYKLNENACYARHIDLDGTTYGQPVAYNVPTVPEQVKKNGVSIAKTLVGGDIFELEGVGFYLTLEGSEKRVSWTGADGTIVDEIYLDAQGRASTPDDALPYGTYELHEDASTLPAGMIAGNDDVVATVTVDEDYTDHEIYTVEVANYKAPQLRVVKVDGDSLVETDMREELAERVEGAVFELAYQGDQGWEVLATLPTDVNGEIDFTSYVTRFGDYRITEVLPAGADDPSSGYMTPEGSWQRAECVFTIDESTYEKAEQGTWEGEPGDSLSVSASEGTVKITRTVANWRYRTIEADKVDQDDGSPIPGTTFELYRYTGEGIPAECIHLERADDHGAYVSDPTEGIDAEMWELVELGTTDANGSFIVDGLTFGGYMLVEAVPAPEYAAWYESAGSTWDRYYFAVDETSGQKQTQVFRNEKIAVECNVNKSTIEVTSAAFNSLDGQVVDFDNVGTELYRYDVSFDNGATNVVADQYAVIDQCNFVEQGVRLDRLWTPVTEGDVDGTYNIWFTTDTMATGSGEAQSATATNPDNPMTDGTNRIKTDGWHIWESGVSATSRTELDVADLGLEAGEHVTGIMLEYGAVEPGFTTTVPMQYMVYATEELPLGTVIENTAESHITRNWMAADTDHEGEWGLYDDDVDSVETRVIGTFSYDSDSGRYYYSDGGSAWGVSKTGDALAPVVATLATVALAALALLALARTASVARRRGGHKQR